jgi:hypothetical protein
MYKKPKKGSKTTNPSGKIKKNHKYIIKIHNAISL